MKKKFAVLVSLMMVICFSLAACGSSGAGGEKEDLSDSKYVGTWVAKTVNVGDKSSEFQDGDWIVNIKGDGTGTITSKQEGEDEGPTDFTWSLTDGGFKTEGGMKLTFTDEGDGISTELLGAKVNFVRADEAADDAAAAGIGTQYGYMGQDPVECAVWKYLVEDISVMYDKPADSITVPVVQIVKTEEGDNGETLVYGDFWVNNYVIDGDILDCKSGGAHPGMMTVTKDGDEYKVSDFKPVEDGGNFEPTAKEIFGDDFDKFMQISSDSDTREKVRAQGLADYVKANGIAVTKYKDYGTDPVELAL